MALFGFLKNSGAAAFNKVSGKTDLLEAGFALGARVAAKEGGIEDEEIVGAIEAAQLNEALTAAFTPTQIEEAAMKQFNRAKTPMGRMQLKKELTDIGNESEENKELVLMIGVMVAAADGNIGPAEKEQIRQDGKIIGLGASKIEELINS